MKSPTLIGAVSPTQAGDCVCSLVAARYIKKVFPNSYSVAVLDPRTRELSPLLINQPDIDRIYITQKQEGYTEEEKEWASIFDYNLPLFGHYVPPIWSKTISWVEANFRLRFQFEPRNSPLSGDSWNSLTEDEKSPKLKPWFEIERFDKLVVLAPFVGYNLTDEVTRIRSPSLDWWKLIVKMLLKMGFTIAQIGMPNSPLICNDSNFHDKRNLSLLESVKLALGSDLFIGACGGMSFIINAYGHKTICTYTNWIKNAKPEILLPVNYKNKMISIYGKDNINSISLDEMNNAICQQLK